MGTASVLVVEDDARLAATIRRALGYEGFAVSVACDGPEGLEALRRNAYDVVVLDRMLPAHGRAGALPPAAAAGDRTRVLMVTARDAVPDRVAGLDAGADDYLVKPFAHEELLARVRALLRRAPRPAESAPASPTSRSTRPAMTARRAGRRARPDRAGVPAARAPGPASAGGAAAGPDPGRGVGVWTSRTSSNVVDVYVGYLRRKTRGGRRQPAAARRPRGRLRAAGRRDPAAATSPPRADCAGHACCAGHGDRAAPAGGARCGARGRHDRVVRRAVLGDREQQHPARPGAGAGPRSRRGRPDPAGCRPARPR